MKVNELIGQMAFSHRPADGISVGIAVINGYAVMAAGFVRDGDCFNRKLARHIIAQRIVSHTESNENVKFIEVSEQQNPNADVRSIIREFRKTFKPDPFCNDDTFTEAGVKVGKVTLRSPMQRNSQWSKISEQFLAAVEAAKKQCVS